MTPHAVTKAVGSLWEKTAPPDPSDPPLVGEHKADVCVVGAGFTGLSAALHLAEAGISVIALDVECAGFGASGRNGGQVLPGFKWYPDELVGRYGASRGERMAAFGAAAPALVYDLIARHGIACGLRNCGWLNAAVDDAALAVQTSRAEQLARRGAKVRVVDRAEARELLGTGRYCGAMLDERAGALNPLAYARGLATAAQRHGARVHRGSAATNLARINGRWRVATVGGAVSADTVLLCTNGYTGGLWPGLAQEFIPINSLQVATRPLPDKVRATILPRGHVVSDTQRILLYFRLDDEGRLIMGGRGSLGETSRDSLFRFVEDAACRLFPQIGRPEWQFRWSGKVALTADHMPHVHELAPGLRSCGGYNGRGVAMASAMGRELTEWVRTGNAETMALPPSPLQPLPFHGMRRPVLEVITAYLRLRDRLSWRGSPGGAL
ncbi:MAG: FAD-binding oxidoreductase [Pseudolabrys sp.]|nr:FAD-binding oxidoreductase [Pseudolabrys sp.]